MPTISSAPPSPPGRRSWLDAHPIEVVDEIDAKCGHEIRRSNIIQHRARLEALAKQGVEYRAVLVEACRRSMDFWVDGFVTTYQQAAFDEHGRQTALVGEGVVAPYVTWPIHAALRREIDTAVDTGRDLIIPKSREMRATWDVLLWMIHRFLFTPGFTAILVSEVEDKVDVAGNPDALFPRIEYVLKHIPGWLWPGELHRTFKHVGWKIPGDIRSIDGTSTTENVGVGGRRTVIMLDEAARNPYLREIWDATRDTRAARIVVSTPLGPNFFRDLCFSNRRIFPMGYWDHPDKGRGRELREDDTQGSVTGRAGRKYWWSPWFEIERKERTRIDVGQNLLLDFDIGGNAVFDSAAIMQAIEEAQRFPPRVGRLVHELEGAERDLSIRRRERERITFVDDPRGNLSLWCELNGRGQPITAGPCVLGADVSNGLGQSNSTAGAIEVDTGIEIAAFADANMDVHEFARFYAMLGIWLGHHSERRDKWACCAGNYEANGSGQNFGKYLRELGYSPIHQDGDTMGWHSNLKAKRAEMEEMARGISLGTLIIRDVATLQEASTYVYTTSGGVEPEALGQEPGARATHGDRVIKTLTAWMLARRGRTVPKRDVVPPDTTEGIVREFLRKQKERRRLEG